MDCAAAAKTLGKELVWNDLSTEQQNSLVPEWSSIVAIHSYTALALPLTRDNGFGDGPLAQPTATTRPALSDKVRVTVEGHRLDRVKLKLYALLPERTSV